MIKINKLFKVKMLDKNLIRFINVSTGTRHKNKTKAIANCFKSLIHFRDTLDEEIKKLETKLLKEEIDYYFLEDEEKVIVEEGENLEKKVVVKPIDKRKDNRKIRKQIERDGE